MEMKKLHMGTMSYGFDSMDEVTHQLAVAFGATAEQSKDLPVSLLPVNVSSQVLPDMDQWSLELSSRPEGEETCPIVFAM
jgi:hypothetical protein